MPDPFGPAPVDPPCLCLPSRALTNVTFYQITEPFLCPSSFGGWDPGHTGLVHSLPRWEVLLALGCLALAVSQEGSWGWGEVSSQLLPSALVLSCDSSTALCVGAVFHACPCWLINL